MAKKILQLGLLGFPIGIAIGNITTIVASLILGQGSYYPAVPALVEDVGSQIGAVIVQTVLCGILGSAFCAASVIWNIETWSITKQTALYFAIAAAAMLPIAYINHWMEHSILGFVFYFVIFVAIFVFIWITQFIYWKLKITKLNQSLES